MDLVATVTTVMGSGLLAAAYTTISNPQPETHVTVATAVVRWVLK